MIIYINGFYAVSSRSEKVDNEEANIELLAPFHSSTSIKPHFLAGVSRHASPVVERSTLSPSRTVSGIGDRRKKT